MFISAARVVGYGKWGGDPANGASCGQKQQFLSASLNYPANLIAHLFPILSPPVFPPILPGMLLPWVERLALSYPLKGHIDLGGTLYEQIAVNLSLATGKK